MTRYRPAERKHDLHTHTRVFRERSVRGYLHARGLPPRPIPPRDFSEHRCKGSRDKASKWNKARGKKEAGKKISARRARAKNASNAEWQTVNLATNGWDAMFNRYVWWSWDFSKWNLTLNKWEVVVHAEGNTVTWRRQSECFAQA